MSHDPVPTRPRPVRLAVVGAALASLLAACGLVATFVPPIEVGDPMGIDGAEVRGELGSERLAPAAVSYLGARFPLAFDDMLSRDDLRGFSIASFTTPVVLDPRVRVEGPDGTTEGDYPDTVTVTGLWMNVSIEDDDHGPVTFGGSATDWNVAFDKESCDADGCTYRATVGPDSPVQVRATDPDDLRTLVDILAIDDGNTPNRGHLDVEIRVDAEPAVHGFTATFRLATDGSRVRLGG